MVEYYQKNKYFYKKYKNGKIIRISKKEYYQKNKKIFLKGGTIEFRHFVGTRMLNGFACVKSLYVNHNDIISGMSDGRVLLWKNVLFEMWKNEMFQTKTEKEVQTETETEKEVQTETETKKEVQTIFKSEDLSVNSVCMMIDKENEISYIISGSSDKMVRVWKSKQNKEYMLLKTMDHTASVNSVCVNLSGTRIISGGEDGKVKVWNSFVGNYIWILTGHTSGVTCLCMSQDGSNIISGSKDMTVKVWGTMNGKLIFTLKGHTRSVTSVCMSINGSIISGSEDGTIKIWTKEKSGFWGSDTYVCDRTLDVNGGIVTSVCMSPSGSKIISGSEDTKVKVWNAKDGKLLETLEGHKDTVTCLCMDRSGSKIISGSKDGKIIVWWGSKENPNI